MIDEEKEDSDREYKAEKEEIGDHYITSNRKEEREELQPLKEEEAEAAKKQGTDGGSEAITREGNIGLKEREIENSVKKEKG